MDITIVIKYIRKITSREVFVFQIFKFDHIAGNTLDEHIINLIVTLHFLYVI